MADQSTEKPDAPAPASDVAAAAPDEAKPAQPELTSAEKAKPEGKDTPLLQTRDASPRIRAFGLWCMTGLIASRKPNSNARDISPLWSYFAPSGQTSRVKRLLTSMRFPRERSS